MAIPAPYRFVPLSKFVLLPEWGHQVSHDHPFADGVSGELDVTLTCHTPLCVGGQRDEATDRQPATVRFCRDHAGNPIIPGTSIKGMLRNVLEIATFARFRQVDDQKLGVRDLTDAGEFYKVAIKNPQSGWLTYKNGEWQIQKCKFVRLDKARLVDAFPRAGDTSKWERTKSAAERYSLIGFCPIVHFLSEPIKVHLREGQVQAKLVSSDTVDARQGRVVVTGAPSDKKRFEFVFYDAAPDSIRVSPEVMAGFRQVHGESKEWAAMQLRLQNLPAGVPGIPVFFHMEGGHVRSMGLAMMYKLPYRHSLHSAIRHTSDHHLDGDALDLPQLLFGHIDETDHGHQSLRGRVSFTHAECVAGGQISLSRPCVLNSPKPTFYPTYIRQGGSSFSNLMDNQSELAGWKRYQTKDYDPQGMHVPAEASFGVMSRLEQVASDSRFTFKLRFHNLRMVELGALLWALDFGGRQQRCRHSLGLGKPFGLGQVSLAISKACIRLNNADIGLPEAPTEQLLMARYDFINFMNHVVSNQSPGTAWEDSGPITALVDYAVPSSNLDRYRYLAKPKQFVEAKKGENFRDFCVQFHHTVRLPAPVWRGELQSAWSFDLGRVAVAMQDALASQQAAAQRAAQEQQRQQEIASASFEMQLVIEAEFKFDDWDANGRSKGTRLAHLQDALREVRDAKMRLSDDELARARALAARCADIDDKQIKKIVKKLLDDGE